MKIFTVHDSKADYYLPPFFSRSHGEAMRSFETAINKPDHDFYKHFTDFTLFEIGSYDDQTGVITPIEKKSLGNGLDFKQQG